uniref:Uncharacterized protein n=1 Tax=Cucumis melo TaxID=3656 RepID=A0A9I9E677_CUCME
MGREVVMLVGWMDAHDFAIIEAIRCIVRMDSSLAVASSLLLFSTWRCTFFYNLTDCQRLHQNFVQKALLEDE